MTSQVYDVTKLVLTQKYWSEIFYSHFLCFCSCYGHLLHGMCNIAGFARPKLRVEFGEFSQGGGGGNHSLQNVTSIYAHGSQ